MTAIPEPINTIQSKIDAYHESKTEPRRGYMGASGLGNPDARALWLGFRWAFEVQFPGRVLRLFRRGHREEETVIEDLTAIGCDIIETGDNQKRIDLGCHVRGHSDGIIQSGVPGAEKTPHLLEIKTMSKKKFDEFKKIGLEKANLTYWVQCHVYMEGLNLDRCLFYAVCKDDDRVHTERIKIDKNLAVKYIQRGQKIALTDRMPEPMSVDPTNWQIKWSDYYAVYFPKSATEDHWNKLKVQRESVDPLLSRICVNWRNDARTTVREDGTWFSEKYQSVIPPEHLKEHDPGHILHPDIMELAGWEMLDGLDDETALWQLPNGQKVANGAAAVGVYSSQHLLADPYACANAYRRD